MKYLLVLFLFGCSTTNEWTPKSSGPGGNGLYRFENNEVVCYSMSRGETGSALQCKFK